MSQVIGVLFGLAGGAAVVVPGFYLFRWSLRVARDVTAAKTESPDPLRGGIGNWKYWVRMYRDEPSMRPQAVRELLGPEEFERLVRRYSEHGDFGHLTEEARTDACVAETNALIVETVTRRKALEADIESRNAARRARKAEYERREQ